MADGPFCEELVFLDECFQDRESFFKVIGDRLHKLGYVKPTFGKALSDREKVYPTGLATEPFPVALPHTDVEHVARECITLVRFREPVEFEHMGSPELKVQACFAFVLGVMEPHRQVATLSSLIKLMSTRDIMEALNSASDPAKACTLLNDAITVAA